jgi:hypothetical protein
MPLTVRQWTGCLLNSKFPCVNTGEWGQAFGNPQDCSIFVRGVGRCSLYNKCILHLSFRNITMKKATLILCALVALLVSHPLAGAREVVAFWGFNNDYDFTTNPNKQDFVADVGSGNLEAYLGVADSLDNNGGSGFVTYTSPTSGIFYDVTNTLKFNDLKGGGNNFDIGGVSTFLIDKNDGAGAVSGNFGNDALAYITLDGTGYQDFQIRFDIEATPGELPATFDIYFRTGATGGVWYREQVQNNISLNFVDYDPADPENQYADSGVISLSSILNGASPIEIILSDFAEAGNGEMELDNIEITANRTVPEPGCLALVAAGLLSLAVTRRRGC